MKQVLAGHWEKLVAFVVVGICAWALVGAARLFASSSAASDVDEAIETVKNALKTAKPTKDNYEYAGNPSNYSKSAEASLGCMGYATKGLAAVTPHLFHTLAPKTLGAIITRKFVRPNFRRPVIESVDAGRGKIEVVVAQSSEDQFIKILRFEVFRKEEGKDYGEKPFKVIKAEAIGQRARGGEEERTAFASASFEDRDVEPKTVYAYKVRAVGVDNVERPEEPEEKAPEEGREPERIVRAPSAMRVGPRRQEKIEVIRPIGVETVDEDGATAWMTPFSEERSGQTPTNVMLILKGISGDDPDWRARIRIKQWNRKIDNWDEAVFTIEEGDLVRGAKIIRYPWGQQKVKFDSGYRLVKLERVTEEIKKTGYDMVPDGEGGIKKVEKTITIPVEVAQVTVKEEATGKVEVLRPPTEEEEKEAVKAGATRRIEYTVPTAPAAGGRRRRRTEPE